ncbi:hypothetical protein LshimejAT787_0106330 [Lyophyllum shimeji]|uniref:Uncharacterized protein n=1 Tax=Lyophyllum shimeji TaxID=47721 RepID=A0A9P3PDZ9_LYOSH|nr:hypothetical protein LshimejAT787_0106330 [Lyophyllum shimeji]
MSLATVANLIAVCDVTNASSMSYQGFEENLASPTNETKYEKRSPNACILRTAVFLQRSRYVVLGIGSRQSDDWIYVRVNISGSYAKCASSKGMRRYCGLEAEQMQDFG